MTFQSELPPSPGISGTSDHVWCWCRLQAFSNVGDGVSTWLAKSMQLIASQHVLRRHTHTHIYIYIYTYIKIHIHMNHILKSLDIYPLKLFGIQHLQPIFGPFFSTSSTIVMATIMAQRGPRKAWADMVDSSQEPAAKLPKMPLQRAGTWWWRDDLSGFSCGDGMMLCWELIKQKLDYSSGGWCRRMSRVLLQIWEWESIA